MTAASSPYHFETLAIHAGQEADPATGAIATNQPPPAGARPRNLGFANATTKWGGVVYRTAWVFFEVKGGWDEFVEWSTKAANHQLAAALLIDLFARFAA